MPAVLTHKAVLLLARERVADIRDRLQAKVDAGARVTDLEHRVLFLARKAHELMSVDEAARPSIEFPAGDVYARPLGLGVSRFAVMGSMGPDITGFSGLFLENQAWVFDTVHKGNPDHQKEPVLARTTDLGLALWKEARDAIQARTGEGDAFEAGKRRALREMRAYTLGHLCHVAGDVLSHPFINDVEWHLGVRSGDTKRERFGHSGVEASIDSRVARRIFLRPSVREGGQAWTAWWPAVDEVPDEFFRAYDAAFRSVHESGGRFPKGFGAFEAESGAGQPPVSPAFIRDGYGFYKHGVLGIGYNWGWWSWWGYLIPLVVPALLLFPLLPALPKGKQFLDRPPWEVEERGWYEMMALPLFLGSVPALFYGIWLATISTHGIEGHVIAGLCGAGVTFVLGLIALATVGVDDLSGGVRWGLLWLVPVLSGVYQAVRLLIARGEGNKAQQGLFAIYAAPLAFMLLLFVTLGLVGMGISGIVHLIDEDATDTSSSVVYGVFTGLVTIALLVAWFWLPSILREARIPEDPEAFPADRRHFVRLFDDGTLFHPASVADPGVGERFYPSETRELLKLWWDGPGEMHVRSRRTHLEFSFTGTGDPDQVVTAPIVAMTPSEYGALLESTVRASDGSTSHLRFALAYDGDEEVFLPPGATFADEGDVDDEGKSMRSVEGRNQRAPRFLKLAASEDAADYTLRHAPRLAQAVRVGPAGAVPFDPREPGAVPGAGTIQSADRDVTGSGTDFVSFFNPGDGIRAGGQVRVVTLTASATGLKVSSAFNPPLPGGTTYERIGAHDDQSEGFTYIMDPGLGPVGGNTVMDLAADLGAILCLGATPHLLPAGELEVDTLRERTLEGGGEPNRTVTPVQQVFRNWSLDRRRENEWRMLVAGGAFDEKGGHPESFDGAMPRPRHPDWVPPSTEVASGEPVTRELGWVPLLRRWLDMASDPTADAADATGAHPTNQELSRAMAYLFDLPDPRVLSP